MSGTYTFRWERPAGDVYVTGTFDNWSRSAKLERQSDGAFAKTVALPIQRTLYKFVVDGRWITDPHAPIQTEPSGIQNSVLQASQIQESTDMSNAHISSAAPDSTTAALAAQVPLEEPTNDINPTISSAAPGSSTADMAAAVPVEAPTPALNSVPGFFPETPANEKTEAEAAGKEEPQEFSVKPLPASDTAENPIDLKPGEPVPTNIGSQSLTSNVHLDKESYERGATNFPGEPQEFSVKPLPASDTAENPIDLKPGEPVPTNIGSQSLTSNVHLDKESYERGATNFPVGLAHAEVPEVVKESQEQAHVPAEASEVQESVDHKAEVEKELTKEVPPIPAISEQRTSMVDRARGAVESVTATISGAVGSAAVATGLTSATTAPTAAPSVPEVVRESQAEAGAPAEASAVPELVEAKREIEEELKEETVVASPIPTPKPQEAPKPAEHKVITLNTVPQQNADSAQTQTAPTVTNGITSSTTQSTSLPASSVPKPVTDSVAAAAVPAEAASQPAAVANKAAVEDQLKKEVSPVPVTAGPTQNGTSASKVVTSPPSTNGKESKKSKRRSFFGRIKDRLHKNKHSETS